MQEREINNLEDLAMRDHDVIVVESESDEVFSNGMEAGEEFGMKFVIADGRDAYNFSPGPCQLPKAVLDEASANMLNYRGSGQSVFELSHRQDEFRDISNLTKDEIRKFLNVPDNFKVLLQQGGATMQYTAIVKNLIGLKPKRIAMLNRTGMFSAQNVTEMSKHCDVHVVTDAVEEHDCTKISSTDTWSINPDASFYSICTNETVNGIEIDWEDFPFDRVPQDIPIIADMSSNIGTNIIPWDKLGMVYAGAQKNLGTAGCTVMIIRDDLFGHAEPDCPILCDWTLHENSPDTYYNTPAIMPMYITGLNCLHMNQNGGLDRYIDLANQRAAMLWDFIDNSDGYYKSKLTEVRWRSRVNIIFRIQGGDTQLEELFISEAAKVGIVQIKAHFFNPGIRISMYNAMPMEGVAHLTAFMRVFMDKYPAKAGDQI